MSKDNSELRILAETQKAFTDWRLDGPKRGRPIPDELWAKAIALLSYWTLTKVSGALKINSARLRQRAIASGLTDEDLKPERKKTSKKKGPKPKANTFVEVVLPRDKAETLCELKEETTSRWRLTLTRVDGSRLEITPPEFSDTRMQALIRGFLGGNDVDNRATNANLCSH